MRLTLVVTLNSGGSITVRGDDLSTEAIHEVFAMLAAHPVASAEVTLPPPEGGNGA